MQTRGFTLLEVVIVMVILALVYTLVVPSLNNRASGAELRVAARNVAAALRLTRSQAIEQQREATLILDVEKKHYEVPGVLAEQSLPEKVDVLLYTTQSEKQSEKKGRIRFFPDGSSSGGHIKLKAETAGFKIAVDWLTGKVTLEDAS